MGKSPDFTFFAGPELAKTALVVMGDPQLRELLCNQLARCGVLSVSAASIAEAGKLLQEFRPDALLIDIDCDRPAFASFSRRLRGGGSPIPSAMLSSDVFKTCGYQGEICRADQCFPKPVHPGLLVQTVIDLLEGRKAPQEPAPEGRIRCGLLSLDMTERTVYLAQGGTEVILDLAPRDFRLLSYLVAMPDKNHTRSDLLSVVWPEGEIDERTIDVSIMRLRKRLKAVSLEAAIVTVPGKGYRFSTLFASTARSADM